MSKCKKEIVEAAVMKLVSQIISTMPNSTYKFILGGATTFAALQSSQIIEKGLKYVSDENNLVDIDMLQKIADSAFNASDGKLQLELFKNPSLLNFLVKPLTLTIQKKDIDDLISEIRQNCISEEVVLSQPKAELSS